MKTLSLCPVLWIVLTTSASAQASDVVVDFARANLNGNAPVTRSVAVTLLGLSSTPSFTLARGTDFQAGSGTCDAALATCSVSITFSPKYPGMRQDAVLVRNATGDLLATAYLHGVGVGPQTAIVPGMLILPSMPEVTFDYVRADSAGNLLVAEHSSVQKIELAANKITTVAGTTTTGYSGDGGPATLAQLDSPAGVAIDGAGNVYIADTGNDVVRRVDALSGIITTVAGNGTCALPSNGVPATQAALCAPTALALDANGNLYINETSSGVVQEVHRGSNIITTVAGNGTSGYSGDGGPATAAELDYSTGIVLDSDDNLYVTDEFHCVVRKVDTSGIITTVAGNGSCSADTGDGGPATAAGLWGAEAVAVDAANNLYIVTGLADSVFGSDLIRKVDAATGTISTIVGGGSQTASSDFSLPATTARLVEISDLTFDANGTLYIAWDGELAAVSSLSSAINFASIPVLQSSPAQSISVSNTGNAALAISRVALNGPNASDFTLQAHCSASLAAGNSCPLSITFRPVSSELRLASIVVQDSGAGSPHTIMLTGVGAPALAGILNPGQLTFAGHTRVGSTKLAKIELTNPGSLPLPTSNVAITGANAADFAVFDDCGASLAPGTTCTLYVDFAPTNPGNRAALLLVTAGSSSPVTASLSGFATARPSDLDADGTSDLIVWRPSDGTWYIAPGNSGAPATRKWGISGDIPLTGDFDGDGKADLVIWRPSNGMWYIIPSSNPGQPILQQWGVSGDIPVAGDFDGDGKMDFAVWRPSNGIWYVIPSSRPDQPFTQQWGLAGDIPVPGDFDFDGQSDFAVWRPSNGIWYVIPSAHPDQPIRVSWGVSGDVPVPADFGAYGVSSFAVWRPSNGTWYVMPVFDPQKVIVQQWGLPGDIPVPGDYDGDGKVDFAVWRQSNGIWYIIPSSSPTQPILRQWGVMDDVPK